MTKVYERGVEKTWKEAGYIDTVVAYVEANAGKSIAEISVAVGLNEEIVTWAVETSIELLKKKTEVIDSVAVGVDTLLARLTALRAGYLDELDFDLEGHLDGITAAVTSIQNNTSFTAAIPRYMCKPDVGNEAFRWACNLYDSDGNPENPDDGLNVRVTKDDGTAITANLYKENALTNPLDNSSDANFPHASGWRKLINLATGQFDSFYKVANDETEEALTIQYGWTEGGVAITQFRSTEVADVHGDLAGILAALGYEGATSLADKLTLVRAGYLDNINNAQLLNVPDLTSLTREQLGFPDGYVWFDAALGSAGTAFPIGTATSPASNVANTKTIADNNKLRNINVHGGFQLGQAWEHYSFVGHIHEDVVDLVDLNGQGVDGSCMCNLLVSGAQGGTGFLVLDSCILYVVTDFQGIANNCDMYGSAMSIKDGGYVDLTNCNTIHGALTITLQAPTRFSLKNGKGNCTLTAQDGGVAFVRGFEGSLTIDAMTLGTLSIYAGSGTDITINGNCSGGTINIYGDCNVTGAGGGCTVNDYSLYTRTKGLDDIHDDLVTVDGVVDAIKTLTDVLDLTSFKQEAVAAMDVNGTTWKDLLDKSTITKPTKICGFAVTVAGTWAGNAKIRIVDGAGNKIFPFKDEYVQGTDFFSATQVDFTFAVVVPIADGYKFQFRSSAAGDGAGDTLQLNNLDVIETG